MSASSRLVYASATERIVAWLRLVTLGLFVLGELLPHPPHLVAPYLLVVGMYAAWSLAALAWVYRRPAGPRTGAVLTCVDITAITALVVLSGGPFSYARDGYFFVPVTVAFRFRPPWTAVATVIAVAAYFTQAALREHTNLADARIALHAGYIGLVGVACVVLSAVLARRTQRVIALANSREQLLADALGAEDRERQALAEALHDHAIQDLLAVRQELELVRADSRDGAALARVSEQLLVDVRRLRETVTELHPYVLGEVGLPAALSTLAQTSAQRAGAELELAVDAPAHPQYATLLYGLARELLANVVRHARAQRLVVELRRDDTALTLRIADDGIGFDPELLAVRLAEGHIGLASHRVRVESAGGRLHIDSHPGGGTRVDARVPA